MMAKTKNFEANLVDEIAKNFRKNGSNATASFLWDSAATVKDWVSTGSIVLDTILSNKEEGGIPVGRLTEIAGGEGAGKSLLAAYILANTQKKGGVAVYIDTEHAASMDVLEGVGVDVEKLIYVDAGSIEEVFEAFEAIVDKIQEDGVSDRLITVVWDSVAATPTLAEVQGTYSDQTIGLAARRISQGMRKFMPVVANHNVACVFINQLRTKIGVSFGDDKITPGGMAIPYYASVRLRLNHFKQIKDTKTGNIIGRVVKCQVKKNKVAPPMRDAYYHIRWGDRLGAYMDDSAMLLEVAIEAGVIEQAGARSYCLSANPSVKFGKQKWDDMLREPEFAEEIHRGVQKHLIITKENISEDVDHVDDGEES